MATVAKTWKESFNYGAPSASKWTNWGGGNCVLVDGQLKLTTTTAAQYFGMDCNDTLDLTGSEVSIQVVNAGNQALASCEVGPIQLAVDSNNQLFWYINSNSLTAFKKVAGSNTQLASTTYNSSTHKYLRIRESGGTCYFDYSSNGVDWTNFASTANPIAITKLTLTVYIGCYAAEASATTAIYDNLNYLPTNKVGNMPPQISTGSGMGTSERVN